MAEKQLTEYQVSVLKEKLEQHRLKMYGFNTPGAAMKRYKTDSEAYKQAKAKFDAMYPKWHAEELRLIKEIDKGTIALEADKAAKDKAKAQEDTKNDLAKAQDDLVRAQNAKDPDAIKKADDNLKALNETAAAKGIEGDDTKPPTIKDELSKYTLGTDGVLYAPDGLKGAYLVGIKDAKGDIQTKAYKSSAEARAAFLKSYSQPGALETLQQELIKKNYIKNEEISKGTWYTGVDEMIRDYTLKAAEQIKLFGKAEFMDTATFFKTMAADAGAGKPSVSRYLSTRTQANNYIDAYYNDLLGRAATADERAEFYSKLHSAEYASVSTESNGTTTGSYLTEADRALIATGVAKKSLKGTNIDQLLSAKNGSRVATDIASLQEYASSYGVNMSAADAMKYVSAGIGQKDYLAKQQERIRQLSITLHPNLKDHLLSGGSVKDIADQYAYTKTRKLGVSVQKSTSESDIMDAITKGVSINDYGRKLQADPRWRTSDEAHSVANDFAQKILSSFGFGG